jgi:hypothetical protein
MAADSALDVALLVARAFEELEVDYLVGGSLASSLHGEPRSTQDVDFVADLGLDRVQAWIERLGEGFYRDRERIDHAVRNRSSFNVIHLATMFKVDVFVLGDDHASRREMARRLRYEVGGGRELWVASAEDVVLQKLIWYRLGNAVSDRQWRDVLAVLRVRGGALDHAYLDEMAAQLDLGELLARALSEADA